MDKPNIYANVILLGFFILLFRSLPFSRHWTNEQTLFHHRIFNLQCSLSLRFALIDFRMFAIAANVFCVSSAFSRNRCNRSHVYIKSHRIKMFNSKWYKRQHQQHIKMKMKMIMPFYKSRVFSLLLLLFHYSCPLSTRSLSGIHVCSARNATHVQRERKWVTCIRKWVC